MKIHSEQLLFYQTDKRIKICPSNIQAGYAFSSEKSHRLFIYGFINSIVDTESCSKNNNLYVK